MSQNVKAWVPTLVAWTPADADFFAVVKSDGSVTNKVTAVNLVSYIHSKPFSGSLASGTAGAPTLNTPNYLTTGFFEGFGGFGYSANGLQKILFPHAFNPNNFVLATGVIFGWGNVGNGTPDIALARNAADILEINNGTAATFRDLKLRELIASGAVRSSSDIAGIGYSTGAGGTVVQATSKSTGVTLNKVCGRITMNAAALAAAAEVTFVVTNSTVTVNDLIVVNHVSAGTAGAYQVTISNVAAGSFSVTVSNASGGSLSEAIVIGFAVIKGVAA